MKLRSIHLATFLSLLAASPAMAGTALSFPITTSEVVTVTGTPRLALDIGGVTRYATFASGSGTNTLTFTYNTQAGDLDLDGIAVTSPLDLNGGTIKDLGGNAVSPLTFTLPNTVNVKVNHPAVSMDFVNGDYLVSGAHYATLASFIGATGGSFSRASTATYYDSSGVLQTAASGSPRFDYDPVTHLAKGLLIEETRTNVLKRSSQLDQAGWNTRVGSTTVASAVTAPDGSATSYLETKTSGDGYVWQTFTPLASTKYTYSLFVKGGASASTIRLYGWDGFVANSSAAIPIAAGQAWTRISYTFTTSVTVGGGDFGFFIGGANPFYAWGGQLEAGSFASSYIPTNAAAVTRAQDMLTVSTGAWLNLNTSTLSIQGDLYGLSILGGTFQMGLGTDIQNYLGFPYVNSVGPIATSYYRSAGAGPVISSATLPINTTYKAGYAFSRVAGTSSYSVNGAISGTGSGVNAMASASSLTIGYSPFSSFSVSGHIRAVTYYPSRATDAQLQLLTQ